MSLGKNLQFFRKMHSSMTQEELAELMGVSRQTVSKWESGSAYPEMDKAIELAKIFSCSMDQLIKDDMQLCNEAYSNIRTEKTDAFRFVSYAVVSADPEGDAINHMQSWAAEQKIQNPVIIGWDFPQVSQEQINIFHMHGYAAACVLPQDFNAGNIKTEYNKGQNYAVITVKEPFKSPFTLIPNAYKTLMLYMNVNKIGHSQGKDILPCFEKEYQKGGKTFMDIYIAADI